MTETERKNLEDAAKAIGLKVWPGWAFQSDQLFRSTKPDSEGRVSGVEWNPLTNAADLIMLMKGCGMIVDFDKQDVCVTRDVVILNYWVWPEDEPDFEHAVVRAAAEYWRARQ